MVNQDSRGDRGSDWVISRLVSDASQILARTNDIGHGSHLRHAVCQIHRCADDTQIEGAVAHTFSEVPIIRRQSKSSRLISSINKSSKFE